jgi:hypothetical protein
MECTSLVHNSINQSSNSSGWIIALKDDFTFGGANSNGVQRFATQAEGYYQVCFRSGLSTTFMATGIIVAIQNEILSLRVNDIVAVNSSVPASSGNIIGFCSDAACTESLFLGVKISFISPTFSCEVQHHNPFKAGPLASGHLSPVLDSKNSRILLPFGESNLDILFTGNSALAVGTLQVCYQSVKTQAFITTGLSLRIQDILLALVVNGVLTDSSPRATIPIASQVLISYFSHYTGRIGSEVSFISPSGDFLALLFAYPVHNCDHHGCGRAGICKFDAAGLLAPSVVPLRVTSITRTLSNTGIEGLQPGNYQVCFRYPDQKDFQSTGVTAQFQRVATGIRVDGENETTRGFLALGRSNTLSIYPKGTGFPSLASLVMSGKSCASEIDNPAESRPGVSGHLVVSNLSFFVLPGTGLSLPESQLMLPPLTYHLCAMSVFGGWRATGLSLTTRHLCRSTTVVVSDVTTQSNNMQGMLNAVRFLINVENVPISDGVLYLSGLTGFLTADNYKMFVEGNSIIEWTREFRCEGYEPQPSCKVVVSDYLKTGHQLLGMRISMFAKCTNFDGLDKTVQIVIGSESTSSFLQFQKGPWDDCINACEKEANVLIQQDVTQFTDIKGTPLSVNVTASPKLSYFDCSGAILQIRVVVDITYVQLGSSILYGSWARESGTLVLPKIDTIVLGNRISFTLVVKNSMDVTTGRSPEFSICNPSKQGQIYNQTSTSATASRVLQALSPTKFFHASLKRSSAIPDALNRVTLSLGTNISIPDDVDITLVGLIGTRTLDTAQFAILNGSLLQSKYECVQVGPRSCITTIIIDFPIETLHKATVSAELFCSDFAGRDKKIQSIRSCSTLQANSTCPKVNSDCAAGFDPLSACRLPEQAFASGPWQRCGTCKDTVRQIIKNFDVTQLIKTGIDKIHFEVEVSAAVSAVSCYVTPGIVNVPVKATFSLHTEFSTAFGSWESQTGMLVFRPTRDIKKCADAVWTCQHQLNFSFELTNPSIRTQVMPIIYGGGSGLHFQPFQLPPIDLVESSNFVFSTVTMRESSSKLNQPNTISFFLRSSTPLLNGTFVTIQGLLGSQTASKICNPVDDASCSNLEDCIFIPSEPSCQRGIFMMGDSLGLTKSASWNQRTGTLIFVVDKSFHGFTSLQFSIVLINPRAPQLPLVATISASRRTSNRLYSWSSMPISGSVLQGGTSAMTEINDDLIIPQVIYGKLGESSHIVGADNTVTVTLQTNVDLPIGSTLMLAGFSTMLSKSHLRNFSAAETVFVQIDRTELAAKWQGKLGYDSVPQYYPIWYCGQKSWSLNESENLYGELEKNYKPVEQDWCFVPDEYSITTTLNSSVR